MKLGYKLLLMFSVLSILSGCDDNTDVRVTNIEGVKVKQYYDTSAEAEKCILAITKLAKGKIELIDTKIMTEWNPRFNKKVKGCKVEKYEFYIGNAILFYNGFGGAKQEQYYCIKNPLTAKYVAITTEDFIQMLSYATSENICMRIEETAKIIETMSN